MKIDMHCHVLGNGKDINNIENDVFFNNKDNPLGSFDASKLFVKYVVTGIISDFIKKGQNFVCGYDNYFYIPDIADKIVY